MSMFSKERASALRVGQGAAVVKRRKAGMAGQACEPARSEACSQAQSREDLVEALRVLSDLEG